MKNIARKSFLLSLLFTVVFLLWTLAIFRFDIQPIGPNETSVGFGTINRIFRDFIGENLVLYNLSDWLSIIPICFVFAFGILGCVQWIRRKNILKVDYSLFVLGVFYIIIFSIYFLFENLVINYRPTLIDGVLEASYPSSTTLLVLTVIPTAILQLNERLIKKSISTCCSVVLSLFALFMVIARIISGVHWLTDIIGGILLSVALVYLYIAFDNLFAEKSKKR